MKTDAFEVINRHLHKIWDTLGIIDFYNQSNNQLTIPAVLIGNSFYNNVLVTVGTILSVGGFYPENKNSKNYTYTENQPYFLPDSTSYYPSCSNPFLGFITTIDLNNDRKKDLVLQYWCMYFGSNSNYTGPTPNSLVVYLSNPDGSYSIGNEKLFGNKFVDLGGAVRKRAIDDLNNDGYLDIAFAINHEDGRQGTNDNGYANWAAQAAVMISNGDGSYRIDNIGQANYYHSVAISNNIIGGKDIVFESYNPGSGNKLPDSAFPALSYRWSDGGWKSITNYPHLTVSTHIFLPPASNMASSSQLFTISHFTSDGTNTPSPTPTLYTLNNAIWSVTGDINILPSKNKISVINWNGQLSTNENEYLINGSYYTLFSFWESCSIKLKPSGSNVVLALLSASYIPSSYDGSTALNENSMMKYNSFVAYDTSNNLITNLGDVVQNQMPDIQSYNFDCKDINNDGYEDMINYQSNGYPAAFINNKNGLLQKINLNPGIDIPIVPSNYSQNSLQAKYDDLDDDGINDLIYFTQQPVFAVGGLVPNPIVIYKGIKNIGN